MKILLFLCLNNQEITNLRVGVRKSWTILQIAVRELLVFNFNQDKQIQKMSQIQEQCEEHIEWFARMTNKMSTFFSQAAGQCMEEIKKLRQKQKSEQKPLPLIIEQKKKHEQKVKNPEQTEINKQGSKQILNSASKSQLQMKTLDVQGQIQKKRRIRRKAGQPKFHSHKPKAPASSFLIFLHHQKGRISEKYNEKNISRLTKLASIEWRKLTPLEKQWYEQQSEIAQKRYHQSMKEYKVDFAGQIQEQKKIKQSQYRNKWMEKKKKIKGKQKHEGKTEIKSIDLQKIEDSSLSSNSLSSSSSSSSSSGESSSSSSSGSDSSPSSLPSTSQKEELPEIIEIPSQEYDSSLGQIIKDDSF